MSYDNGSLAFRLRQEIRDMERFGNPDFVEGEEGVEPLEDGWASFGEFQLVGNGKVTNEFCGKFLGYKGCLRVENHNKIIFNKHGVPVNCSGKVYIKIVHHYCDKPSCPACYRYGWAVRETCNVELRLAEASKRFGRVEHIVCSVPSKDYRLSFEVLRRKVTEVLFGCGVFGGVLIFHGFRYDLKKHWYWSPHFHVLGFIRGGYARCRHCKGGNCYACDGFEGRVYRCYRENGYIVKALEERITVGGTAWYQLHHSTIRVNVKRPHACTWFGVCSYRKLKITVEKHKNLCPICNEETYKVLHYGSRYIAKDRNAPDYVSWLYDDLFDSDGLLNWVEAVSGSSR